MNRNVLRSPVFIARFTTALGLSIGLVPSVHAEKVETPVGTIELELGVPNEQSAQMLFDSMDFQRACQAYLWALPAVGFEYVLRKQRNELGARNGDVVIYKGYRDVSRFLTPNVTTPYIIGFMDLAEAGPMMLQVPAGAIAGSAMDFWQRPPTDFGICQPAAITLSPSGPRRRLKALRSISPSHLLLSSLSCRMGSVRGFAEHSAYFNVKYQYAFRNNRSWNSLS